MSRVEGLYYNRSFVTPKDRLEILDWLKTIRPIWEERFSENHPPPPGEQQRWLLRPVYWLGSWQFACLNYYHPPRGIQNRCVEAEPFPPVMQRMIKKVEATTRRMFGPRDLPPGWHLNVCLVNFYGSRIEEGGKRVDAARVGDHKDFEPGPVASISLGERAMFQFVASSAPGKTDRVALEQWLDDGSLQIFGGQRWKSQFFHRVQRVDTKGQHEFDIQVGNYETRRINFTFRYVPDEHVVPYWRLPKPSRVDVRRYMAELAKGSEYFARELAKDDKPKP